MRPLILTMTMILFCSTPTQARSRWYRVGQVAWAAANLVDVGSSWGKRELNPVLGRGRFGRRQAGIKLGVAGGWLVGQEVLRRRVPESARAITVVNLAGAGGLGVVAVGNWRRWGR